MKNNNQYIRKARKKRRIKRIIVLSVLIVIIIGILVTYTDVFKIKNIKCVGENLVTGNFVVEKSEELKGENLLFVNRKKFMDKLKDNPYVEEITFKKKYPNTLEISVKEKKGLFYYLESGQYNIFNDQMIYLEKTNSIEGRNLIEVKGVDLSNKKLGDNLWDSDRVGEILKNTYKVQKFLDDNGESAKITLLDISNLSKIKVCFGEIEVKLGNDENLVKKIKTAAVIYKQNIAKKYIDVSFNGSPDIQ
ncbi:FtsQ-type POTRA domain-containing protein [Clostridium sp. SHJSY1]|uniref:cell division protein FtsQ/DivIB n=1 Tax=Clostridium sp. SHJSY1 TaxID=2942483 RepID=UPI00287B6484|nr:FtsQ-type POTRA domain-containing protein [Clostridium sp. SHJSY1]